MICKNCGAEIILGEKECFKCGLGINEEPKRDGRKKKFIVKSCNYENKLSEIHEKERREEQRKSNHNKKTLKPVEILVRIALILIISAIIGAIIGKIFAGMVAFYY